eukprot:scaffold228723_cov29-Tisochrysis_lutea.AAC.1
MLEAQQRRARARGDKLEEERLVLGGEVAKHSPQVAHRRRELGVAARIARMAPQVGNIDGRVVAVDEALQLLREGAEQRRGFTRDTERAREALWVAPPSERTSRLRTLTCVLKSRSQPRGTTEWTPATNARLCSSIWRLSR